MRAAAKAEAEAKAAAAREAEAKAAAAAAEAEREAAAKRAESRAAAAERPCEAYQLDTTASVFGLCTCGWAKAEHSEQAQKGGGSGHQGAVKAIAQATTAGPL